MNYASTRIAVATTLCLAYFSAMGQAYGQFCQGSECDARPSGLRNPFRCCGCPTDPGTLFRWPGQSPNASPASLDEPIVTDRPDFTEASSVVGKGVAQFELGYTYTFDNDGVTQTIGQTYPEALLRYGVLADWLEFRFAWNWNNEEVNNNTSTGADDIYLGFKIGLTSQCCFLPEMALLPQMTVPSGSHSFSNDRVLPGLNWLYSWDLNDCLSLAGSTQFNRSVDDVTGSLYTEWAQSVAMGVGLGDRWGAYSEWFAFFPSGADTAEDEHYFNGGFTYLVCHDVQWDIRSGVGLNDDAADYFVGTGLSIRLR